MSPKAHLLLVALALPAAGQTITMIPESAARLRLLRDTNGSFLELSDPGNHAWRLQTSVTPGDWTNGPSHRVVNGLLRIPVTESYPWQFFRMQSDGAEPLPSNKARALLLPAVPYNYANPPLSEAFLASVASVDTQPADNVVTDTGATLGRVLFYDKRLSANQTVSCASCHQAEHGFADPRPLSVGFAGVHTRRNSMGLTNARYTALKAFLWDLRGGNLENQVLMPIQDPIEMGMTLDLLIERLSTEPFYAELFTAAFGTPEINNTRIARALAQFIRSITSANTKAEAVSAGTATFTDQELVGRALFTNRGCTVCHFGPNLAPFRISNNGLESPTIDQGVGGITGNPAEMGLFKFASLRNVELTAPYMHDGRFQTLEQVLEFYSSGIVNHPNLDPVLRTLTGGGRMKMSAEQQAAVIAFLKTLTDTSVTTDPKFSDPFRYQAE